MRNVENDTPILYCSNQTLVDEALHIIGLHYLRIPECDFYESLSRNVVYYGCTMVMNRELREAVRVIPNPSERVLQRKNHDAWVLYGAFIRGIVIYDNESRILYRQHAKNAVGVKTIKGKALIADKWIRFTGRKYKNLRSELARDLLNSYDGFLTEQMRSNLETIVQANSILGALRFIQNERLVKSFRESRIKIYLRGVMKWI